MTINRAIEILDPEHRERYDDLEEVNEACRMGMQALQAMKKRLWIPVSERHPEIDEGLVEVICTAQINAHHFFHDAIQLAEYDECADQWILEGWPELDDVQVSHWRRLPPLPEGLS